MQQVWTLPGPQRLNYLHRLARSMAFLVMLALGLIVTTGLTGLGTFGQGSLRLAAVGAAVSAVVGSAGYLGGFRILTPRVVPLRQLVPGAVTGGVACTITQSLGVFLMGHYLHTNSAVYGMFAVVLALVAAQGEQNRRRPEQLPARRRPVTARFTAGRPGRFPHRPLPHRPLPRRTRRSRRSQPAGRWRPATGPWPPAPARPAGG
jgi:hypothetical protein